MLMLLLVLIDSGGPGDGGGANDGNGGGADGAEKICWKKTVVDGASVKSAIAESGGGWW